MKRNLQEGKMKTRVIYEGNGFCRVMKGGKLVERLQLEKGDNLLEAFKKDSLQEGKAKFTKTKPTYYNDFSQGMYEVGDITLTVHEGSPDENIDPTIMAFKGDDQLWFAGFDSDDKMYDIAEYVANSADTNSIESGNIPKLKQSSKWFEEASF